MYPFEIVLQAGFQAGIGAVFQTKQGSDLRDLRLTWRKMENMIFGLFMKKFGGIIEYFWRNERQFL